MAAKKPCGCKPSLEVYVWSKEVDGETVSITYTSLMVAKAKVLRSGGSYKTVPAG